MKVLFATTSFLVPFFMEAFTVREQNYEDNNTFSSSRVIIVQPYNMVGGIRHYWNNDYYVPQPVYYDYRPHPYYTTPVYNTPGAIQSTIFKANRTQNSTRR
jgi:hypothetical protein